MIFAALSDLIILLQQEDGSQLAGGGLLIAHVRGMQVLAFAKHNTLKQI